MGEISEPYSTFAGHRGVFGDENLVMSAIWINTKSRTVNQEMIRNCVFLELNEPI